MKKYIGVKIVEAKPMSLGNYNKFRGWAIPDDEDPVAEGYQVKYPDGYVSWCPKKQFEEANRPCDAMTFGHAVEAMKQGKKVLRSGWNGKKIPVVYQKGYPDGIPCNKQTAETWGMKEGDIFKCEPYFQIRMVNGSHSMWVPSINDVFAEDWQIVE